MTRFETSNPRNPPGRPRRSLADRPEESLSREVRIPVESAGTRVLLAGTRTLPARAGGVVLFAHGSGSSRYSPRNQAVAATIREAGLGTLLFDLLTQEEEAVDRMTGHLRFDVELPARRLVAATHWLGLEPETAELPAGYFGASTGAAAALIAAAELGQGVGAVVSRGGRPDLAGESLSRVEAPTLLIVGGRDDVVLELNEEAFRHLRCEKELRIVPGATHLFEEPGALEEVARLATEWLSRHLKNRSGRRAFS